MKALYLLLFVSGAAMANDAAILKCRALGDGPGRLACYDAIPVGAAAAAPRPDRSFGQESRKRDEAPQSIESTIVGKFDGWGPGSQIRLANGQVWRVIDDSEVPLVPVHNPKVKMVRNLFGNTFMEIEGTNQSAKVRRVQ
jgi:hypothetical protein